MVEDFSLFEKILGILLIIFSVLVALYAPSPNKLND